MDQPSSFLFHGGKFLDPRKPELQEGIEVLVEGDKVKEVSDRPIVAGAAQRVNLGGRTLMPGLIDAHVHIFMSELQRSGLRALPITAASARAAVNLRGM